MRRDDDPCLWGGRFKDLFQCQGKRFFFHDLEAALRQSRGRPPALTFQAVRPGRDAALRLRIESAKNDTDQVAARVEAAIRAALDVLAELEVLERGSLPLLELQSRPGRRPSSARTCRFCIAG